MTFTFNSPKEGLKHSAVVLFFRPEGTKHTGGKIIKIHLLNDKRFGSKFKTHQTKLFLDVIHR